MKSILSLLSFIVAGYSIAAGQPKDREQHAALSIDTSVCFNRVQVVDLRPGVHTGSMGVTLKFALPDSLAGYIEAQSNNMIRNAAKGDRELLLVIYAFEPGYTPDGTLTFIARTEIFTGKNGVYHFFRQRDDFFEQHVKKDIGDQARELETSIIYQYLYDAGVNYRDQTGDPELTLAAALTHLKDSRAAYPIYKTQDYHRGVYYSAAEFLNNTPSDTSFMLVNDYLGNMEKILTVYDLDESGKKGKKVSPDKFFAVCEQGKMYCVGGGKLINFRYVNGEFYTCKVMKGLAAGRQQGAIYYPYGYGGSAPGALVSVFIAAAATVIDKEIADDRRERGKKDLEFYQVRFVPERNGFVGIRRLPQEALSLPEAVAGKKWPLPVQ